MMSASERFQALFKREKALIFGHRGASAHAPMNTLAAFELARTHGADGVELDVHLTADDHLVVIHDHTVDAATDGSGEVSEKMLAEIKQLDAGSWFDVRFAGTRIPTLDEVFEAVGKDLIINVEIKTQSAESDGTEAAVAACITRHQMADRVLLSSFNPHVVNRCAEIMPDIARAFLVYDGTVDFLTSGVIAPETYQALHPHHTMIDAALIKQARAHQHGVNTWTVNDPDRARELIALGVDCVITDDPRLLHEAIL